MSHLRLKTLHKNAVLFKVRTTKPNKYNVKPKQGVLLQGARLDAQCECFKATGGCNGVITRHAMLGMQLC